MIPAMGKAHNPKHMNEEQVVTCHEMAHLLEGSTSRMRSGMATETDADLMTRAAEFIRGGFQVTSLRRGATPQ